MHIHILQHADFEKPALIEKWAIQKGHKVSFTKLYEAFAIPFPTEFDLLIIMGAPINVYDDEMYPWLSDEKDFIYRSIQQGKKVLGICFGSQLIADALGSKVYANAHKEVGWFPLKKEDPGSHALLDLFPDKPMAFHWHGDTFDIPENCNHLFSSELTLNQGFVYQDRVFALQFHWEMDKDSMQEVLPHMEEPLEGEPHMQTKAELMNTAGFQSNADFIVRLMDYLEDL